MKNFVERKQEELVSEASIHDKKTKLPVCASLKWTNPPSEERKPSFSSSCYLGIYRLCTAEAQGLVQSDLPAFLPDTLPHKENQDWTEDGEE